MQLNEVIERLAKYNLKLLDKNYNGASVKMNVEAHKDLAQILAMKITKDYDSTYGSGFIKGDVLVTTMYKELLGQK